MDYDKILRSEISFDELADILLNKTFIKIQNRSFRDKNKRSKFRIREIEFYYYDSQSHPDPFTHKDEHQEIPGRWYFHRQNGKSYKGGTYKGLDITFGSSINGVFGGILIRSIQYGDTLIEGPCKVVDFILKTTGSKTIEKLLEKFEEDTELPKKVTNYENSDNESPLYLCEIEESNLKEKPIYKAPRVGLSLKKSIKYRDLYVMFIMKPYRYMTGVQNIKKNKNLNYLANEFYNMDPKIKCTQKWLSDFENGKEKHYKYFIKNGLTKQSVLCEFYGYWTSRFFIKKNGVQTSMQALCMGHEESVNLCSAGMYGDIVVRKCNGKYECNRLQYISDKELWYTGPCPKCCEKPGITKCPICKKYMCHWCSINCVTCEIFVCRSCIKENTDECSKC